MAYATAAKTKKGKNKKKANKKKTKAVKAAKKIEEEKAPGNDDDSTFADGDFPWPKQDYGDDDSQKTLVVEVK